MNNHLRMVDRLRLRFPILVTVHCSVVAAPVLLVVHLSRQFFLRVSVVVAHRWTHDVVVRDVDRLWSDHLEVSMCD